MADTGGDDDKGLSAAGSRRIAKRVPKVRMIAPAAKYTITDPTTGEQHVGTFKMVSQLCPKIGASTLKRRLEKGLRDLVLLRRAPETKLQARMRRMKK